MDNAYYSPSTNGIYPSKVFNDFPPDAVKISDDLYSKYKNGEVYGFEVSKGKVIEKIAPVSNVSKNQPVLDKIAELEMQISPRRIREAILTDAGKDWLSELETEISALRLQLK